MKTQNTGIFQVAPRAENLPIVCPCCDAFVTNQAHCGYEFLPGLGPKIS
jgi:hypothetical protein